MNKTAIYTSLFGNYDNWQEPEYVDRDSDYFIFTDQDIRSKDYRFVMSDKFSDNNILQARSIKILYGYKYLCNMGYDLIIYHDSNMQQRHSLLPLTSIMINDVGTMKHPTRNCIYKEYEACCDLNKDDVQTMYRQTQRYANLGYPKDYGLIGSGVLFRRNKPKVLKFCEMWMQEVKRGSIRDQLSFNYAAWKFNYKFDLYDFNDTLTFYFNYFKHKNK